MDGDAFDRPYRYTEHTATAAQFKAAEKSRGPHMVTLTPLDI